LKYQNAEAAGTGMVLTSTGEVLTNNHVIDGATSISVRDVGNNTTYRATVVGYDRSDDVAVLQLQGASGLSTVSTASTTPSVGAAVVAVGNAGGTGGTPSYAGGSITATGRSITASDESDGTSEKLTDLLETDADVQAGDSGGPLVNEAGKVVGMDTAGSTGFSFSGGGGSDGYAIPISRAVTDASAIVAGKGSATVHIGTTAMLGVEVAATSSSYGSASASSGAAVAGTVTGGPAATAGLAAGDVITAINGQAVDSPDDLSTLLGTRHPGDTVTVAFTTRSGTHRSVSVQLTSGPPQ
jgi:S1-C subfamily serine protease